MVTRMKQQEGLINEHIVELR